MQIARHTIVIGRPREAVFDFFLDLSQASRWRQFVESMQLVTDEPIRAGSRIRTTIGLFGDQSTFDLEVLALERPALWRHRTFESDFTGHVEYRFEPDAAGTRVTFTIQAKPKGLYGWLAMPMMWLQRGKPHQEQLPQLKRVLEEAR